MMLSLSGVSYWEEEMSEGRDNRRERTVYGKYVPFQLEASPNQIPFSKNRKGGLVSL